MPELEWPSDDEKRKVRYEFKDEKELNENGMAIPLENNRTLSKGSKGTSR